MEQEIDKLRSELKGLKDRINNLVAIQCSEGTEWDNEYMRGLANGLLLAQSTYTNKDPKFFVCLETKALNTRRFG